MKGSKDGYEKVRTEGYERKEGRKDGRTEGRTKKRMGKGRL
jgi:hypothetical protein